MPSGQPAGRRRYKTIMPTPVFKRILLKLSGEALAAIIAEDGPSPRARGIP